jgi:xanthine dehydrogenase accessory factor
MNMLEQLAEQMRSRQEPYVMALVVRCESPTSAKPGARALITRDGTINGWIGGGCAQPIVLEEARRSLRDGTARLVRITPNAGKAEVDGLVTYEMVCHSGGTMDIFVEPVLPLPQIVILGRSPVARTLTRLAKTLGYRVCVLSPHLQSHDFAEADERLPAFELTRISRIAQSFVVVSSQGEDDEGAMLAAARAEPFYLAFVASPKKWKAVSAYLAEQGVPAEALKRVQVPAGVPILAKEPEEIALSILAQIVQRRREPAVVAAAAAGEARAAGEPAPRRTAVDPVCNMTVDPATAAYRSEYAGQTVYFCCSGCKQAFDREPERYLRRA